MNPFESHWGPKLLSLAPKKQKSQITNWFILNKLKQYALSFFFFFQLSGNIFSSVKLFQEILFLSIFNY